MSQRYELVCKVAGS